MALRKDRSLDDLARVGNVAQFVSFSPGRRAVQEFSRVAGLEANHKFASTTAALCALVQQSPEGTINIRSFTPENPRSRDFHYALRDMASAEEIVENLVGKGLYVIANETVDVSDGGISGVIQGGVAEFAPDDTPRCVEKGGTASLPLDWAQRLIGMVYGFPAGTVDAGRGRLEFSIHPKPRGWKKSHTLMWEYEGSDSPPAQADLKWPNRFSRLIGDKTFGLIIAHLAGLPVPRTTCLSRRIAPFSFGLETGSREVWTRTCPTEQEPGRYSTVKGWTDPFQLLADEDPTHSAIPSVLCQAAVPASFAGAAIVGADGDLIIEGAAGEGDEFMLGRRAPERLPSKLIEKIRSTYAIAFERLGPVRFEWVFDGRQVWIVQMHKGATDSSVSMLVPGDAEDWRSFDVALGLDNLRGFLSELPKEVGVRLLGEVGLTSHIADLIRKHGSPARFSPAACL